MCEQADYPHEVINDTVCWAKEYSQYVDSKISNCVAHC